MFDSRPESTSAPAGRPPARNGLVAGLAAARTAAATLIALAIAAQYVQSVAFWHQVDLGDMVTVVGTLRAPRDPASD